MTLVDLIPWLLLAGYAGIILLWLPRGVTGRHFFDGRAPGGGAPGLWLLVASAAITWIFAKSIVNAANQAEAFGLWGGIGYAAYYLSFATAAIALYLIRTRGGFASLPAFLTSKYGALAARLFVAAIAIRLFNEVWSNTKVVALFFGPEASPGYWMAAVAVTGFTAYYSWRGGLRSSLVTDGVQMVLAAGLLIAILATLGPGLAAEGLPRVGAAERAAGLTFTGLALVQALSYPFHDPVLTDRGFLSRPRTMLVAFLLAGLVGGVFILLFSLVGLQARAAGLSDGGGPVVAVALSLGLPMLVVFNAILMSSAGSTLDSTFASTAKLVGHDLDEVSGAGTEAGTEAGAGAEAEAEAERDDAHLARQMRRGRWALLAIAVAGNLPLLSVYVGDKLGPAIIAATTISGTMVMGLAPIILLGFLRGAGALSFHLAFWPGIALGVAMTLEGALGVAILPGAVDLGQGPYADDLGVNLWGLGLCSLGFVLGSLPARRRRRQRQEAMPAPRPPARPVPEGAGG